MRKKIIYTSIALSILFLVLAFSYLLWLRQGRTLKTESIPTAEFLAQYPIEFPSFIGDISPDPGTVLLSGREICVGVYPGELMKSGDSYQELRDFTAKNTQLLINDRPLFANISYPAGLREVVQGQETGTTLFCVIPQVETGIHIAEIKTKDLSGIEYTYQWAFIIE